MGVRTLELNLYLTVRCEAFLREAFLTLEGFTFTKSIASALGSFSDLGEFCFSCMNMTIGRRRYIGGNLIQIQIRCYRFFTPSGISRTKYGVCIVRCGHMNRRLALSPGLFCSQARHAQVVQ